MTISEILKAQGIADETITAVLDAMKANKVYTASEENLDIRYGKLKEQHDTASKDLADAKARIAQYEAGEQGQANMQQELADAKATIAQLTQDMNQAKADAAVKVELLAEKALDVDYLTYKLREKLAKDGKTLEADENSEVKGLKEEIDSLKTQFPHMFSAATGGKDGLKVLSPNKLPTSDGANIYKKAPLTKC